MFRLIKEIQKANRLGQVTVDTQVIDYLSSGSLQGGIEGQSTDESKQPEAYRNIVWVYRAVSLLANNMASVPLGFFQVKNDGSEVPITSHEFDLILKQPNKFQTASSFKIESFSRLLLQGELFWELTLDSRNRVQGIYADWRSDEVRIKGDNKELITAFIRNNRVFTPEEVFYIKFFNPFSVRRGASPLFAIRNSIDLDLSAVDYNKNFFKNGMQFSGVFSTDRVLTAKEADRLNESIRQKWSSKKNMHKPGLMWGGLKFQPLNDMSLKDADFIELRKMNREEIAGAYGVPLEVLGLGKNTFENLKFARRLLWTETIIPLMNQFVEMINVFLVPRLTNTPGIILKADFSKIEALKEDRAKKREDYVQGFKNAAITPNDMRTDVFGKKPIEDPAMDSTYLPANIVPVASKSAKALKINIPDKAARDKLWHDKVKRLDKFEKSFIAKLKTYFRKQEKDVIAKLKKQLRRKGSELVETRTVFDLKKWIKELEVIGAAELAKVFKDVVDTLNVTDSGVILNDPVILDALGKRVIKFSKSINDTTSRQIAKQLVEGFKNGEGLEQLSARIQTVFEAATESRAALIARTEVFGASNFSTQMVFERVGIQTKVWLTSRDARVRFSHTIDGQVVKTNEMFTLQDGTQMPFPQDFNERCSMTSGDAFISS